MVEEAFRSPVEGSVLAVLYAQHARVRDLLAEVRGAEGERRGAAFEHAVVSHLSLEETEEFPVIEEELDPHESAVMARWIERAIALGPTRPHPATVGSPVAQRVVARFTALLDHARDLLESSRDAGDAEA
jgi:hypothetical protein